MDKPLSYSLSEDEKTAMQAFLSYHYGNYRYIQEQWSADVLPFQEWITTLGLEKLWAVYASVLTERDQLYDTLNAIQKRLARLGEETT